jgi:site-specific DNA-cytosine methylase
MAGIIPLGGGMTIGLERAGWDGGDTILELSEGWTKNILLNRPQYTKALTSLEEWERWAEEQREDPPQLVYGSPPCQGVTGASRTASADNPKNEWALHFTRTALRANPNFIMWENIPRMLTVGRPIWTAVEEMARAEGYSMTVHHHDAQEFGVCQRRKRVMFVMEKKGHEIPWPTHEAVPAPTTMEVIGDLENVETTTDCDEAVYYDQESQNEYQRELRNSTGYTWDHDRHLLPERFETVNPGTTWFDSMPRDTMTEKERARIDENRLYNAMEMFRLHPDRVARTITGSRNRMHPTLTRLLSVRECSRLMGFPDDWKWAVPGDVQQFAAGVCPPICEWYGDVMRYALTGEAMPVPEGRMF